MSVKRCIVRILRDGRLDWPYENAVVAGISLCTYDPWEKYYAGDGSDYTWSDFKDEVEENAVSVGDDRYFSYSMLTW